MKTKQQHPNTNLLRKLANHLLSDNFSQDYFDFSVVKRETPRGTKKISCGCALGEMPVVWPETWFYDSQPCLQARRLYCVLAFSGVSSLDFFGISKSEFNILFVPETLFKERSEEILSEIPGVFYLSENATKERVANNILAFCDYYDNFKPNKK